MRRTPTLSAESRALERAHRHPGGAWVRVLAPFFERIRVDAEARDRLVQAHERGHVVHVLRARRVIDPLYILYALGRLGLPRPAWIHDHFASRYPGGVAELGTTLVQDESALLFLKRPRTLISPTTAYAEGHVEALIRLQRELDRPILLLPETLQWTKRATGLRPTIIDSIFGDREAPGRLREILGFLWHHRDSRFHVGAPVNIQAVLEREQGQTDQTIAKKIRWSILHHLTREEQLRTGGAYRGTARAHQMVINDTTVRRYFANQTHLGASVDALEKKAKEVLKGLAADPRYGWMRVLDAFIDVIWSRIYDGIVVDQEGLARVRTAARKGPVVLVPSHKSHVDYLVLGQVFFKDGMMPPHVAAGDNLNFPPVGFIFRRSGAFFIRRSFKGDKLYTVVFAAYVRRLLKNGHAVEFFIEGGRSRTGKLLPPKLGMLTFCVDPCLDGVVNDVSFVPVSISYEKIVEARSYARELDGGEKKKEDVGALLSSTRVLRSRYGRVYVDFAEPISLRVFAAARGFSIPTDALAATDEEERTPERRTLVNQLGHRLIYGISAVTRVTPTAIASLILLARSRGGIEEEDLYRRSNRIIDFLEGLEARVSTALRRENRRAAVREALGRLADDGTLKMVPAPDGETIFQVDDAGRRTLDYYKNNILHFFVPFAIVASSILAKGEQDAPEAEILPLVARLSHLLKFEFSFRDQALERNFEQAATYLVSQRILSKREENGAVLWSVTRNGRSQAIELASLIAVFFEAFRLAAETLDEVHPEMQDKKFVTLALLRAKRQVLEGRITRAEAASKLTIESALDLLADEGILERRGKIIRVADDERRQQLIVELTSYLKPLYGEI